MNVIILHKLLLQENALRIHVEKGRGAVELMIVNKNPKIQLLSINGSQQGMILPFWEFMEMSRDNFGYHNWRRSDSGI